jgi:hypothetical protein
MDFMKNVKGIDVKEEELDEFKAKLREKILRVKPWKKSCK